MWHGLRNDIIMRNVIYAEWRKKNYLKLNRKPTRFSVVPFFGRQCKVFLGTNLKEQPLYRSVYYCWLKPIRQSSTLEFTRIKEEITSSSGKLYEAARKWYAR